jgi:nucleoside-diphosphate-sugar epimerase
MASASERTPLTLITGGSGYFGSVLAARLMAEGTRVRVLDLAPAQDCPAGAELYHGDIRDPAAVARACAGVDTIFHCVAQVPLARDATLFDSVNRVGTEVLADAARGARVRKVVHLSSSAVFGVPQSLPVTMDTPRLAAEAYGRAKRDAEDVCAAAAASGTDITIIRPRTILGHGRLGIFQIIFEWVRQGLNVPVLGRGDNIYQFVHAADLADACLRAARRPGASTYNIGAERFGTMRETLEALCAHAGTGSRVVSVPRRPAVAAMKLTSRLHLSPLAPYHWVMFGESFYFDLGPAQRELGWSAEHGNADMIVESYEWYLANRHRVMTGAGGSHHRAPVKQGILKLVGRLL